MFEDASRRRRGCDPHKGLWVEDYCTAEENGFRPSSIFNEQLWRASRLEPLMQGPKWHPLAVVPPSCNTMMPKDPESSQKIHHPPFQHPPGYVPKNNKHQSQSNTRPDRNPKSLKARAAAVYEKAAKQASLHPGKPAHLSGRPCGRPPANGEAKGAGPSAAAAAPADPPPASPAPKAPQSPRTCPFCSVRCALDAVLAQPLVSCQVCLQMMHLECYASNSSAVLAPDSAAFCPLHPQSQQAQEPGTESLKVRVKIVKTEGKGAGGRPGPKLVRTGSRNPDAEELLPMSSPPRRAAQPSAAGRDDGVGGGRDRDADMSTSPKPHSSSKLVRSPSNSSASRRAHFPKQVRSPDEAHGGGGLKAELDGALGSAELDDGELALLLHQELNAPSQRRRTREMRLSSLVPTSSADSMTLEAVLSTALSGTIGTPGEGKKRKRSIDLGKPYPGSPPGADPRMS